MGAHVGRQARALVVIHLLETSDEVAGPGFRAPRLDGLVERVIDALSYAVQAKKLVDEYAANAPERRERHVRRV